MSILTQINRIRDNVQAALAVCSSAGVEVADGAASDQLPAAVEALAYGDIDCGFFGDAASVGDIDAGTF